MNNEIRYLLSDLNITDQYIEKFKLIYLLPEGKSDDDFRQIMRSILNQYLRFIFQEYERVLAPCFLSYNSEHPSKDKATLSAESLFHYRRFHDSYLNQLNSYLKSLIFEIPNADALTKEVNDEIAACLINITAENLENLASEVINNDKPNELIQCYNTIKYKIKNNKNLMNKLHHGESHGYPQFLIYSIDYLDIKLRHSNPDNIKIPLNNNTPKPWQNTFESLFKDRNTYQALIEFMAKENLVSIGNGIIRWKGYKRNRKFEVVSFYEALFQCGYLQDKARISNKELSNLASNSFSDFTISSKTIRNTAYDNYVKDYVEMLARFTSKPGKVS